MQYFFENCVLGSVIKHDKWFFTLVWPVHSWDAFWIHFHKVSVPHATYSISWGPDQYPCIKKTLWSHQWIITSREKPSTNTIQEVKKNSSEATKKSSETTKKSSEANKVIWSHPKWSQTRTSHVTVNENHPKIFFNDQISRERRSDYIRGFVNLPNYIRYSASDIPTTSDTSYIPPTACNV